MLKNILLAIDLPLVNAEEYIFLSIVFPLVIAGEFGYCHAISESWRIICWPLSYHKGKLENILLIRVLQLLNAGEYFVG